jgi:hypothetical protein
MPGSKPIIGRGEGDHDLLRWLPPGSKLTVENKATESRDELRHRLDTERRHSDFELWRARVLLVAALVALGLVLVSCLFVLLVPSLAEKGRQWAVPVLSSILSSAASAALAYKAGGAEK